jgi:S1-C subfamily serine protease
VERGDVILEINGVGIGNFAQYSAALEKLKPGSVALMLVYKKDGNRFLALKIPGV